MEEWQERQEVEAGGRKQDSRGSVALRGPEFPTAQYFTGLCKVELCKVTPVLPTISLVHQLLSPLFIMSYLSDFPFLLLFRYLPSLVNHGRLQHSRSI